VATLSPAVLNRNARGELRAIDDHTETIVPRDMLPWFPLDQPGDKVNRISMLCNQQF
jgi:hypothetical protein